MNETNSTQSNDVTLAFSLGAIERLEDPKTVFDDAQAWSRSIGIIDDDTERIEHLIAQYDLRQDFDIQERDKWFVLEEITEATPTRRHVYVGAGDEDMRESTMFDWEYVNVTDAAEKANWRLAPAQSDAGIGTRLIALVRSVLK